MGFNDDEKKFLPETTKSVIWDTFYEIVFFAGALIDKVKVKFEG